MILVQLAFCSKRPHWPVCPASRDVRGDSGRALGLSWAEPASRLCCTQVWRSERVLSSWGPSSDCQLPAHRLLPTCFTWHFGCVLAVGIADTWPVCLHGPGSSHLCSDPWVSRSAYVWGWHMQEVMSGHWGVQGGAGLQPSGASQPSTPQAPVNKHTNLTARGPAPLAGRRKPTRFSERRWVRGRCQGFRTQNKHNFCNKTKAKPRFGGNHYTVLESDPRTCFAMDLESMNRATFGWWVCSDSAPGLCLWPQHLWRPSGPWPWDLVLSPVTSWISGVLLLCTGMCCRLRGGHTCRCTFTYVHTHERYTRAQVCEAYNPYIHVCTHTYTCTHV